MKKLSHQINESLNPATINEASNSLAKSIEALFRRVGLKELKIKVPDNPEMIVGEVVISKLLMETKDAGMLQPLFKELAISSINLVKNDYPQGKFLLTIVYQLVYENNAGKSSHVVHYMTNDNGNTWIDRQDKQF